MDATTLVLDSRVPIGRVDTLLFGGFLEHRGRAVYEGIPEPHSRHADADGCRADVLNERRELNMTVMRYPGGNCKMGWTPMLAVNLGTGTPEEARNGLEYCNCPTGTQYADLRAHHGHAEPYGVKLWCRGSEMDGPRQLGHGPAAHYAIRAQQAAKPMEDADRSVETVACGSSAVAMPTYVEWDRQVLEHLGDAADYISLHRYVDNRPDDTPDVLAVGRSVARQIEEIDAVCRAVPARRHSRRAPCCASTSGPSGTRTRR